MKVHKIESSKKGFFYDVLEHPNGDITCHCDGWKNRHKCRHVKEVAELVGRELRLAELPDPPGLSAPTLFEDPDGFVNPMLASTLKEGMSIEDFGSDHIMEEKFNGHRRIVLNTPDGVFAWSRAGNLIALPGHIIRACTRLAYGVFDGELMAATGFATDVKAKEHADGLTLHLFDILSIMLFDEHGHQFGLSSATSEPQNVRREYLVKACSKLAHPGVLLALQYPVNHSTLTKIWNAGGEGVIIKHKDARYVPGKRSKQWIKIKHLEPGYMTVTEFIDGLSGAHSIIAGVDDHGVEVRVKSLNDEWRDWFEKDAAQFIGRRLVFEHQGRSKSGKYTSPMADHWEDE
jgi:ATP-dependent DNA ligase